MGKNANFVSHKKSKQIVDGKPKLPLASDLVEGEIAINFGKDVETLSIKNESGDVVTFSSDNYYTEKKLGSGFTGENSGVTVTDAILWVSGTGENAIVQKGGGSTASGKLSVAIGSGTTASGDYSHAEGNNTVASSNYSHAEGNSTSATNYSSHAEGTGTQANGNYSHAEGYSTSATSHSSHAEGYSTSANGVSSHAEGAGTKAIGYSSHAEGTGTQANGGYSHAEGTGTQANGDFSHAEGNSTSATSHSSHAEGYSTSASGDSSHAEGNSTVASGYYSHAEGNSTSASGDSSHAEGTGTQANGYSSHAEGNYTVTIGNYSHAEGYGTQASGDSSHAEGNSTVASDDSSHAEGNSTSATNYSSHAEGNYTVAVGYSSHAEGSNTVATSHSSHAEGTGTKAIGNSSHAEGTGTKASGYYSHAEGLSTSATSNSSHAEGNSTSASGNYSHAEGNSTSASGNSSHAEGNNTVASGDSSHAEGTGTQANGNYSHAEGNNTVATSHSSHAEGIGTIANNVSEHASGQYNVSSTASTEFGDSGNTLFSVGNGTAFNARHNAFEIRQNGDIYIVSGNSDIRLQDYIGSNITVDQVLDDTTYVSTNPISSKAVYKAVTDNELVWTNAYVTLSGTVSAHTANTEIHVTAADKEKLHTHSNKAALDSITSNVGTMAYENKASYYAKSETSGATQISNALGAKVNSATYNTHTGDTTIHFTTGTVQTQIDNSISGKVNTSDIISEITPSNSGSTAPIATKVIAENELIISNALNDLNTAITAHTADTNVHFTTNDRLKWGTLNRRTRKNFTDTGMTYFINTLKSAIADQDLEKYGLKVGDYCTATHDGKTYNYVIAGLNTMRGTSTPYRLDYDHVGIIVDTNDTHAWNTSNNTSTSQNTHSTNGTWTTGTSAAGYASCDLQYYLETTVLPNVKTDLGSGNIKSHYKLYSNAVNTSGYNRYGSPEGCSSSCTWYANQEICALSEVQVYGSIVWSSSGYDTGEACRQLDVFRVYNMNEIFEGRYHWLRDIASSSCACNVDDGGYALNSYAEYSNYVAALILFA